MDVPPDFEAFCRDNYPHLLRAVQLYCGDRQTAEDAVQEALVKAGLNWKRVATLNSPLAWTTRVSMNEVNSFFRRRKAEFRARSRLAPPDSNTNGVADALDRLTVERALKALGPRERAVLVLRYYLQLSLTETATALEIPVGTVKSDAHRGLERLRSLSHLS